MLIGGVVALHAAYLLYQMCGGLLAFRSAKWLIPHLLAVTWGIVIVAMQWKCPLTELEKSLRAGEGTAYTGSYLDHYVFGTYLPNGTQNLVYGLHLAVILAIYALLARRWLRTRQRLQPARS